MQVMAKALKPMELENLMRQFEADMSPGGRLDKEQRDLWARNVIYQDGATNNLFLAYLHGYVYGIREATI